VFQSQKPVRILLLQSLQWLRSTHNGAWKASVNTANKRASRAEMVPSNVHLVHFNHFQGDLTRHSQPPALSAASYVFVELNQLWHRQAQGGDDLQHCLPAAIVDICNHCFSESVWPRKKKQKQALALISVLRSIQCYLALQLQGVEALVQTVLLQKLQYDPHNTAKQTRASAKPASESNRHITYSAAAISFWLLMASKQQQQRWHQHALGNNAQP
jgi:hypothetical protein